MTVEEQINKTIEPLDKLIAKAKRLTDHPDSITLTEAYENMPLQINLNDPSLPGTKT